MMGEFNSVRAANERLQGLQKVYTLISARASESEKRLAEAETDHNALLQMKGFMRELVDAAQADLQIAQQKQEGDAQHYAQQEHVQ